MSKNHRLERFLLSLLAIALLLACNSLPTDPTPTPASPTPTEIAIRRDDCLGSIPPSDSDVEYTLAFAERAFPSEAWQRTYEVQEDRVRVSWINSQEGALAFLENVVYACGYTSDVVDRYFSRDNIEQIIYADYQDPRVVSSCRRDEKHIRLFEISAMSQGQAYAIRHWVLTDDPRRVLNMLLAYPVSAAANLDLLAEKLFPQLVSCPD